MFRQLLALDIQQTSSTTVENRRKSCQTVPSITVRATTPNAIHSLDAELLACRLDPELGLYESQLVAIMPEHATEPKLEQTVVAAAPRLVIGPPTVVPPPPGTLTVTAMPPPVPC